MSAHDSMPKASVNRTSTSTMSPTVIVGNLLPQ